MSNKSLQHLVHEQKWEVVLPCSLVKPLVVNAYSPTSECSYGNKLIIVIPHNFHTTFLWNHLVWTHACTIRNMIDHPSLQKIQLFLSHLFFHNRI